MQLRSAPSKTKLIPSLLLVLIMLLLGRMAFVQASPETIVKVDPLTSFADAGEIFIVNITVIDVQNLYGIEVDLYWNASVLELANVDIRLGVESHPDGVLHENFFNITEEKKGQYTIAATSINPAPSFNGSGNIVRINFTVIGLGSCKLDLDTKLYDRPPPDGTSSPIEHTTIDGYFEVIPEFPDILILFLFMFFTIFVVIFSKKFLRRTNSINVNSLSSKQNLLV